MRKPGPVSTRIFLLIAAVLVCWPVEHVAAVNVSACVSIWQKGEKMAFVPFIKPIVPPYKRFGYIRPNN